ncbi:hypothetical protein XENORESO_000432 [Xenotaenia resolanae]|uniref:palmitoyl-protein hydrolase n=1 Tax=Xenotaenia resolanae TaxID=208358 RepID=A0ABV0X278_9TELE
MFGLTFNTLQKRRTTGSKRPSHSNNNPCGSAEDLRDYDKNTCCHALTALMVSRVIVVIVKMSKWSFFTLMGQTSTSIQNKGETMLGPPDTVVELGETELTEQMFMDHLSSLGETTYRGDRYSLFEHNCNTFTNEVAQFLTGRTIPSYITDLPSEVLST